MVPWYAWKEGFNIVGRLENVSIMTQKQYAKSKSVMFEAVRGQKNRGFWKGIGIQNFTSLSSYSFNRIGIIPYP